MRRLSGSRLGALSTLSVVLVLGVLAAVPAAAQTAPLTHREVGGSGVAGVGAAAEVELTRPARGANAVRLLGDQLDETAARNDLSAAELTDLLTTDRSAWVDVSGAVFFKDEVASAPASDPVSAAAPLDQTFLLHSNPGASKTIYLDFDGGSASATGWHVSYPATPTTQPAWDLTGDPGVFDDAERTAIQTIWQSVAEDYAPFDVDVTTADPGPAGTNRANIADTSYGSHVLITPSSAAHEAICNPTNNGSACGGVAYLSVFDAVAGAGGDGYGYRQPAWVFPQKLGNSPKNIAEAASHEVGHNFGLRHDANATAGYDSGHGIWAPIMGVGYSRPVSQWSKGDYVGADNQEDDIAIIRGVAGPRADEAPTGIAGAPAIPTGTAYVTSRTDIDTYLLGTCTGQVTVSASALDTLADLDILLSILDATGQIVATDDVPSTQRNVSTASGMGASLAQTLTTGTYYASIDGVGNGPWSTGYDDYGSLGAYTLAVAGCGVALATTTTTLGAVVNGRSATLTAGVATTSGAPAGTVEFRDNGVLVSTQPVVSGGASVTLGDLTKGDHAFRATFVPTTNALFATSQSSLLTSSVTATSSATTLQTTGGTQSVALSAGVTVSAGTAAGTVEFREGAAAVGTAPVSGGSASLTLTGTVPGQHTYTAVFVPADTQRYEGSSSASVDVSVTAPPPPAPTVSASTTRLSAPKRAAAGTRPVLTVTVLRGSTAARGTVVVKVGTTSRSLALKAGKVRLRLPRVKAGTVRIRVRYLGNATTSSSRARHTIKVGV